MPQLPLLGELRAPYELTIKVIDHPQANEPTSTVTAVVKDRKGSVLAGAAATLKGIECDCVPSVVEAVTMAYLFADAKTVERALRNGARDARAHRKAHEKPGD